MPLIDDLKMPLDDRERSRRAFLGMVGGTAMALAGLGTTVTAVRFLWPEVLFEEDSRYRIGRPEEIPIGMLLALPDQKLFVVRDARGFYALSAVCTHLGCLTRYEADQQRIFCPCHGSRFGTDGEVTVGPAVKPLPRLLLTLDRGEIVVDVSKVVDRDAVLSV
jgi:cytochrome b6-f complex iron-sulfur subunit